ncbi:hypothetical protein C1646_768834 [Rhizophagus diaphanus]|nr:hypothetical protein C1646_768834 [Rhizophagus diaphanus] [Rhizophagus sp. MUCL 43196]
MSEASTPISSATATGNESFTLADKIKKYKTHGRFAKEEDLELDDDNLKIICKEKCRKRKKCSFSSYKTLKDLKEVLAKYGIDGNGIGAIHQFPPKTYTLENNDEKLIQYIKEIKRRLENMRTLLADSNEAMRYEYISAILYASLYIVKKIIEKKITLAFQLEVVSEKNTGHIDYVVKALEKLICITEGKLYQVVMSFAQNLVQCESALQSALKESSEEKKELFRNVKRVIEVVVGLLKDRVDVEKESAMKKQQVQEYFEKK